MFDFGFFDVWKRKRNKTKTIKEEKEKSIKSVKLKTRLYKTIEI